MAEPESNRLRVAVVEDDRDLRESTVEYLSAHGYAAWGADSASAFMQTLSRHSADVVLLDLGLPDEDGLVLARRLSTMREITVIIVSARDALDDRVRGLGAGADRYLVKPVDMRELIANLEAVHRRRHASLAGIDPSDVDARPVLTMAPASPEQPWRLVRETWSLIDPGEHSMQLTATQFRLLSLLLEHPGDTVPRKTVADALLGKHAVNANERLDVMLARLRRKCAEALGRPLPLKTIPQQGYAFTAAARVQ